MYRSSSQNTLPIAQSRTSPFAGLHEPYFELGEHTYVQDRIFYSACLPTSSKDALGLQKEPRVTSQDELPPAEIAMAVSRTGSNCSVACQLQRADSSGGSNPNGRLYKALMHPTPCSTLNGGVPEQQHRSNQHQPRWHSVPLPLYPAQPTSNKRPVCLNHPSHSLQPASSQQTSTTTHTHHQPPVPASSQSSHPSSHTATHNVPLHAPILSASPTFKTAAQKFSSCAPAQHSASAQGGASHTSTLGSSSTPSSSSQLIMRPKTQKGASFNHNLQGGRRKELFVRISGKLYNDGSSSSSDEAAEEKATWELLARRSSAEQAASIQRRSAEHHISHHRRKLSSASSLPVVTADSLDMGEVASAAAADVAPPVVQAEQQQVQRQQQSAGIVEQLPVEGMPSSSSHRLRGSYHLTHGQAAMELFLRLSRARQTLDFVRRQSSKFASLNHVRMSIWEALSQFSALREYEAALFDPAGSLLDPDMPLMQHALQSAELCRLNFPDKDWMHLVGLIHGLGKLLAHPMFRSEPQWAICGESFPVGCRFDSHISGFQFCTVNPDRRRRILNTPLGIYKPRSGLQHVFMSWGAPEFLYLVLSLNLTRLPPEALFLLRCQKFFTLTRAGASGYRHLLSEQDEAMLPLLRDFQRIITYRRVPIPEHARLKDLDLHHYYDSLIEKYLPGVLLW